ncbi:hypothetical protein HF086_001578 [Spodoptera exigua]|uniref:Moesin/ezrin/radixin homolog 1 n=1 Tax=Spodoptera exigua TaxID=7107 RepID=A0A922MPI2_SPOEX|nr:hypothetical protein HF086_001578 [Spodoptera exigua]
MPQFRRKKASKSFPVKVCTLDAELEFNLEWRATGRDLFDLVCRTIGLRETWFFGLQFEDTKHFISWLKLDKRVQDQCVSQMPGTPFMLLCKLYPEDVAEELIQEVTQHLLFLQVKQAILSMDIYCPPEASVLLASYAVQAKYGDYDESAYKPGMLASEDLLPQRVIDQYQMTPEMYADHKGMSRDEAEMEYLKIAQDLDMYGVNYFAIKNKKETELYLGVTALGLNIYEKDNKLTPKTTFPWSEIKHISFDDKKFVIKFVEKTTNNFIFFSPKGMNKLRRSEETAELLAEKGRVAEEEASLLAQKAADAERENARLRLSAIKTEEEKVHLERKTREAEYLTARLVEESEKRAAEAERLKAELVAARMAEKQAKEKLLNFLSRTSTGSLPPSSTVPSSLFPSTCSLPAELGGEVLQNGTATVTEPELNSYQLVPDDSDPHIHRLSLEIEKERVEYLAKSKHLQQQLDELRCEFSVLRVDQSTATLDRLHEEQTRAGDNKYSTLRRLKQGSTKTRVAFYEEL